MTPQEMMKDLPENSKSRNSLKRLIEVDELLEATHPDDKSKLSRLSAERYILVSVLRAAGFNIEQRTT